MSHGQASVERWFNDNNVVLHHNMAADSVIARRFVKNYMSVSGLESYTVLIIPPLLKSAKCAPEDMKFTWKTSQQKKEAERRKESGASQRGK